MLAVIQRFDYAFSNFCLCHRFNWSVARLARAISHTGDGHLYGLFIVLALALDHQYGATLMRGCLIAFAIELPLYFVLKNTLRRQRPISLPAFITPSDRYSLPSGHTAAAFLMATLVSTFYPSVALGAYLWALAIGISRVLLGVHFVTDIVVGIALGVGAAQVALLML